MLVHFTAERFIMEGFTAASMEEVMEGTGGKALLTS
jgi:hypothetical protein